MGSKCHAVQVLTDPAINGAMIDVEAMALLKMVCDLSQGDIFEVQIQGCSYYARVVLHALKSFVWHEFSRAQLALIDLFVIGLAILDYLS